MNDRNERIEENAGAVHRRDLAAVIRFLLAAIVVAALVIIGLDNRKNVRIGYVFGDANAPVWIVLVASALAGIVIGWLIKHRPRDRR